VATPGGGESAVAELLRETGGEVLSGPGESGVYRLTIPASDELDSRLERLRSESGITFVAVERP
jgi:hypothetical protein